MVMKTQVKSRIQEHEGLHFMSRMIGILAIVTVGLYMRALMAGGFLNIKLNSEVNGTILFSLLFLGAIGLIVAWRWPRLGGLVAVLISIPVAWYVGAAIEDGNLFAAIIYGSPLLIAGGLYLMDAYYHQQSSRSIRDS
jgi:hypothetical protein